MKTFELKVGDKIELRDDLEERKQYGNDTYYKAIPKISHIESFRNKKLDIVESGYVVTPEMISKVNDRKVKFTKEFEYTIMEDEMIDPKSLVQSGDFVVCDSNGVERVFLAIPKDNTIILAHYPYNWVDINTFRWTIKKIYRFNVGRYSLDDEFAGKFSESCGKFIYDSERDSVKEVTMEDVEKKFGCKVKIVKGE